MIFRHMAGSNVIHGRGQSHQFTCWAYSYVFKSKLGNREIMASTCFSENFLKGELF